MIQQGGMFDPANTSTSSAVQQAIWQSFGDLGIEIPYPHQVEISQGGQEPQGAPQRGGDVEPEAPQGQGRGA